MKILPYVLFYDVNTDMPIDFSKINKDGTSSFDSK